MCKVMEEIYNDGIAIGEFAARFVVKFAVQKQNV